MTLTNLLIPAYTQMLKSLSSWLDKAQKQVSEDEAEALLSKRLAPDMFPLCSQIIFACFQAQEATYRLRGISVPEALSQLAQEGQNAGDKPGSIADAQLKISNTLSALDELEPDSLDSGGNWKFHWNFPRE